MVAGDDPSATVQGRDRSLYTREAWAGDEGFFLGKRKTALPEGRAVKNGEKLRMGGDQAALAFFFRRTTMTATTATTTTTAAAAAI